MIVSLKQKFNIYKKFERDIWGITLTDRPTLVSNMYETNEKIKLFKEFNLNVKAQKRLSLFYKIYQIKVEISENKMRRYIYRIDIINPYVRRKFYKKDFLNARLMQLFFFTFKNYQLTALSLKAKLRDGNFGSNFFYLMESYIMFYIYRTHFLRNIFSIVQGIKSKLFDINTVHVNTIYHGVKLGDIVKPSLLFKQYVYLNLKERTQKSTYIDIYDETIYNKVNVDTKNLNLLIEVNKKHSKRFFFLSSYIFISYRFLYSYFLRKPKQEEVIYPIKIDLYKIVRYL